MNIVYWMITKFVIFGVWKFLSINKQITLECVHFYSIICPLFYLTIKCYVTQRSPKVAKKTNNIKSMWVIENVILVRLYSIGKHEEKKMHIV
jgi:hypothetical protein